MSSKRGRRGYFKVNYRVYCSWAEGPDVTLQIDNSPHLMFGFSAEEAMTLGARLWSAGQEALEAETQLDLEAREEGRK